MEKELGSHFKQIDIAKLHNEVASDIRHAHVHWIDQLNRIYGKDLEWWFGSISSRNIYHSNLFQYSCYLEILKRLWDEPDRRPRLVFVECRALLETILTWTQQKGIAAQIANYQLGKIISLSNYFHSFINWVKFPVSFLMRYIAAYVTRKRYKQKKLPLQAFAIVDTYVIDSSLLNNGSFRDIYFPFLHEYLEANGNQVLVHPKLYGFRFNYFSIYQRMRKSQTHFIIPEDYLRFVDYFTALCYPIRTLRRKIDASPFLDFDLSEILREEQRILADTSGLKAKLIYSLFLRLGEAGLRPKFIVSWYENQVIDKALIAGASRAFPQTKIIGAQIFLHSSNYLNLFPSQSEVEAKLVPHFLLETSKHQCQVAQSFTKEIPCYPAGALRYTHVFNRNRSNDGLGEKKSGILVLLSFDIGESIEMLEMICMALDHIRDDISILIKCHPTYPPNEIIRAFGRKELTDRFKIFQGTLRDTLNDVALTISSNSSSIVEAAALGIPVIFLGRGTVLNLNILSNIKMDLVTECFSTKELVMAINKYLTLSPRATYEYREMGKKVRELFFQPVNPETMLPFLGIVEGKTILE